MREFKFRAWEISAKFMVNDFQIKDCFQSVLTGENEYSHDYEVMQFTGLTDKNGVEIYEGDILSEPVSPVGGEDGGYLYKSRVIQWLGAGSGYSLFCPSAASSVIGNIYSNPELLKAGE